MAELSDVPDAEILLSVRFAGLAGRELVCLDRRRMLFEGKISRQAVWNGSTKVSAATVEDGLPEIVADLLRPLYELFDLYGPPPSLYAEELRRLRRA